MELLAIVGLIIAIIALKKASGALSKIQQLNRTVDLLTKKLNAEEKAPVEQRPDTTPRQQQVSSVAPTIESGPEPEELDFSFVRYEGNSSEPGESATKDFQSNISPEKTFSDFISVEQIKAQWMIWLGGLCVSLSGIFLVKYSIDQGYLNPRTRIIMGITTGVALHIAAEWWRRKNSERYGSIAALAGGASITLFAALLAALHLYHLWSPMVIFGGLVIVSMATMWLALLHGPILAILGILGAYLVPLLVNTGSQNIDGALIYSLIISASAFLLMRWVYRSWLWWGTMAGGLFWVAISVLQSHQETWDTLYLTIFGYLMLSLQKGDFLLKSEAIKIKGKQFCRDKDISFLTDHKSLSLLILIVAQCFVLTINPDWPSGIVQWLPMMILVLLASRYNQNLQLLPWVTLLGHAAAIIVAISMHSSSWSLESFRAINQPAFMLLMLVIALTFSGFSFWNRKQAGSTNLNASLTWLSPVICIAVIYICQKDIHGDLTWTLGSLLLGAIYAAIAGVKIQKGRKEQNTAWLIISTHAAYSMAVVIMFSQASLTLALSIQVISLVWISQRFVLSHIDYVIKAVIAVVLIRLTLNPWLFTYPDSIHWSLWTYGGSFAAVALSAWFCTAKTNLRPWLEGAAIHLLILFLNSELRYWLYAGNIFAREYSFTEAAINTNLWAAMAMVYLRRSRVATWAKNIYEIGAQTLMVLAVLNFLLLLTGYNPLINNPTISSRPIINILMIAYGLPIIMWLGSSRFFIDTYRKPFQILAVFSFWFFISLEIRHLWRGGGNLCLTEPISNGELYTYSLAWLLMGVAAFVLGIVWQHRNSYQAGLVLLGLVIAKIFLVDLDGLQGILRVFSFMGLGLCLLGLAFLHQYLDRRRKVIMK